MQELANPLIGEQGIDSGDVDEIVITPLFGDDETIDFAEPEIIIPESVNVTNAGKVVNRAVPEKESKPERDATSAPPKVDEWLDFFSRVVIKVSTDWYIGWAFRGIDEDVLSDKDVERIRLSSDERKRIATPFAEFANKNRYLRRHGRVIISATDSIDSLIILGTWFSRVSRIARKYRPVKQPRHARRATENGSSGQGTGQGTESANGHSREFPNFASGYYSPGSG